MSGPDRSATAPPAAARAARAAAEREVQHALHRAALYRLLGRAFGYPTGPMLAELAVHAARAAGAPACDDAVRALLTRLATAARETDPLAVAEEHVFLFDRQVRCPPYESAYGEAPRMAGKPAALADIAGFYRAFGLAPAGAGPDLEDHVGTELEFMSALALKEAFALAQGHGEGLQVTRDAARRFLGEHLGCWAEAFARAVAEASPLPYYAAAATLLAAWIAADARHLGVTPVRVAGPALEDPLAGDTFTCPVAEGPGAVDGRPE
jgi:TorA maturation chaperone TorD